MFLRESQVATTGDIQSLALRPEHCGKFLKMMVVAYRYYRIVLCTFLKIRMNWWDIKQDTLEPLLQQQLDKYQSKGMWKVIF